jgi:phosphoketolase
MQGMNDIYNLSMAPLHGAGHGTHRHHHHRGSGSKTGQRVGQPSFIGSGLMEKAKEFVKKHKIVSKVAPHIKNALDAAGQSGYGKKRRHHKGGSKKKHHKVIRH